MAKVENSRGLTPRRLRGLVVPLLTVLALVGLARETAALVERNRKLLFHEWEVEVWRPGAPPEQRLEWFVREAEKHVPPGSRLAFTSVLDVREDPEALHLCLWAAYLLPELTVRPMPPEGDPEVLDDVGYWAAYNTTIQHPRARPLFEHPGGALYEVTP